MMTLVSTARFFSARARRGAWAAGVALGVSALAGCGGVGGGTDAARIRAVNVAVNADQANILVNGASANGDQKAFTPTAVSGYLYLAGNKTSTFSWTTAVTLPAGASPPAGPSLYLSNNQYYTAFLLGRTDVNVRSTNYTGVTDPRFLQVVVTSDSHPAPASGNASVRVVDAAPDAGPVDVLVNGKPLSSDYTGLSYKVPVTTLLPAPYVDVPAGTLSVQVNVSGAATPVVAATSVPVSAGKSYTLVVTEPSTTPTYGLQTIPD